MINAFFWNIRGVARAPNLRRFRKLVRLHDVKFLAISKPKQPICNVDHIRMRLLFDSVLVNPSKNLWVFFSSPFICSIVSSSAQHITLSIYHPWLSGLLFFSFVHAKCTMEERRELWHHLLRDKPNASPWCIGGDFNVVTTPHEKCGGRPYSMAEGNF